MIARLARPLVPVLWRIEDRESTSRGMEELGSSIRRESYPSFWFLLASEWRPEYDPVLVSGLSECVNIRFCIYLLGIDCIPESTEPPIDTHELVFSTRNIYDISPVKFPRICTENLTPSSVVYKILGDVLSEEGFHRLFKDGIPSLEIVAAGEYHDNKDSIDDPHISPKKCSITIGCSKRKNYKELSHCSYKKVECGLCPGLNPSLFYCWEKGNKIHNYSKKNSMKYISRDYKIQYA